MELVGGVGLGILVGSVVGLSTSPTVATLLGALTALLAGFLGLQAAAEPGVLKRITGYGLSCTVAIVLGIYARTHQWLSEDVATAAARWKVSGLYSDADVRRLVSLELLNVDLSQAGPTKADPGAQGVGALHAAPAATCAGLSPEPGLEPGERRMRFVAAGGQFRVLADALAPDNPGRQSRILDAVYVLACATDPR